MLSGLLLPDQTIDPSFGALAAAAPAQMQPASTTTRAAVLQAAVARARPSAGSRMRAVILRFQAMDELMECPICPAQGYHIRQANVCVCQDILK